VAIQVDKPTCKADYDKIRWYLLHQNIWISIDLQGDWILEFRTPCRNIDKNNRCSEYGNRPKLCQDYPADNELCERQTEELCYTHLFRNVDEFESYLDNLKIDWRFKTPKEKKLKKG
jgi:Fe-S-cluster containining protein